MSYHFLNVENGEYFYCDEDLWLEALSIAKSVGWKPHGTFYDIPYEIDDQLEFISEDYPELRLYTAFMIITYFEEWDGNYTDKSNQIILEEDSINLADALRSAGFVNELTLFIEKGSFRICS